MSLLHLRCGDDLRDRLPREGIEGAYLCFSDPVCQGPARDDDTTGGSPRFRRGEDSGASRPKGCLRRVGRSASDTATSSLGGIPSSCSDSLRLPRRSGSLRLLQRARDEAHRFGLAYNRKRRTQRTITSELLNIPGVGPTKRRRLLERFGSLAGVRSASASELATVPGFSSRLAERILNHLNNPN